jgi:C4-dicarboxylate-specific signal transduction histidine kinase
MADHNRLEQVFINLVTNAIDAMDEKAEREECKGMRKFCSIQTFVEKGRVVITVEDNGIGMREEVIEAKFSNPFSPQKKSARGPDWVWASATAS